MWNAAATGLGAGDMLDALRRYAKYAVPPNVCREVSQWVSRYGRVRLEGVNGSMMLVSDDAATLAEICSSAIVQPYLRGSIEDGRVAVDPVYRGHLKQALIRVGYPVEDLAGYVEGGRLEADLRPAINGRAAAELRPYQERSVAAFWAGWLGAGRQRRRSPAVRRGKDHRRHGRHVAAVARRRSS